MALIANRKSVMTLFSHRTDIHSHRVRLVLAEKGISYEIVYVDPDSPPEDLLELSPYAMVPTLVDRDLVLYDSQVIMEFLDERFPHPPLMPVDPVSRGRTRMTLRRIQKDWDNLIEQIEGNDTTVASRARQELAESLIVVAPIFEQKQFFMNDEFSLMDCAVVPILWRLPLYGIELPVGARLMHKYAERMFTQSNFKVSLSEAERELR